MTMTESHPNQNSNRGRAPELEQPIRGAEGATVLGARNPAIEHANPDAFIPPATDAGTIPNLKFSFAAAHNRLLSGGWAREVTVRELPVATQLSGVNMRLDAGGVRELHWHKEAEWAYMIAGSARVTAIDAQGRSFVDDLGVGDLWYFPAGLPHSIQGLEQGCEFLLVFDDGAFSENETFLITDWFAHTPLEVLGTNFGVSPDAFAHLPTDIDRTRYMFPAPLPSAGETSGGAAPAGAMPESLTHRLLAQEPIVSASGRVRTVDSHSFAISKTIAASLIEIEPGALRELHWHPNSDEWQYYLSGQGRMTVFASSGRARTFDYQAGDVGYVPFAMGHYVQNTGDETLRFLAMFRSDHYADISLAQWVALTPPRLVKAHLNLDDATIASLSAKKQRIVGLVDANGDA